MSSSDAQGLPFEAYLDRSIEALRQMREAIPAALMAETVTRIVIALKAGRPLLTCGNGGSAADAQHITGELVGRFLKERRGLKAICLSADTSILTAWANDYSYDAVFARQVEAYGEPGAVLLGLSTSGNSRNVVAAFEKAREMGVTTIALTGQGGGKLKALSDVLLAVPSDSTPLIQQAHVCLYHFLCERIEAEMTAAQAEEA